MFGSTTLIPQILQSLYGYRAIDAGLVLGPGALVITFFAPITARLIQKYGVSPRALLTFSFVTIGASMLYYSGFTVATDYKHYALARAWQGLGYGFLFVPLNVLAYSYLNPDQNNKASSLTNLFRNWGGSFGIACMTTVSARREQFHQALLGSGLDSNSLSLHARLVSMQQYLIGKGFSGPDAEAGAPEVMYAQLHRQVHMLSFMDCFRLITWITLAAVPLLLLVKRFKPAAAAPAASHGGMNRSVGNQSIAEER